MNANVNVPKSTSSRRVARVAAVQALYQIDLSAAESADVIEEFKAHRTDRERDGVNIGDADDAWFAELVSGTASRLEEIDLAILACLDKGRTLSSLETVMRVILRSAAYEFIARADVPAKVIINEYVEVAYVFFTGNEPKFANGVLDRLAQRFRAAEIAGQSGATTR